MDRTLPSRDEKIMIAETLSGIENGANVRTTRHSVGGQPLNGCCTLRLLAVRWAEKKIPAKPRTLLPAKLTQRRGRVKQKTKK
jgi:hypothetical protein